MSCVDASHVQDGLEMVSTERITFPSTGACSRMSSVHCGLQRDGKLIRAVLFGERLVVEVSLGLYRKEGGQLSKSESKDVRWLETVLVCLDRSMSFVFLRCE